MTDTAPNIAVLDAGVAPSSLTAVLCQAMGEALRGQGAHALMLEAQAGHLLPFGEGNSDGAERLRDRLAEAHGVILCFPVYNFNMNATLKAVIEHCGPAMAGKVVGLMATAGGRFAYMSVLSVVQSLMFDLRAWIVPRQVYALTEDFDGESIASGEVRERVEQLAAATCDMARRMRLPLRD